LRDTLGIRPAYLDQTELPASFFLSVTRHVGRMSEGDRTADGAPSGDTAPEEAQTNEGRLGRSLVSARADPLPECAPEVAVRPRARSGDPVPEYDP
jgi:hypothetical protein